MWFFYMPYSSQYLMKLASRGKRLPNDTPEPHLWLAVGSLSAMEIDQAIAMGASVSVPNGQGLTPLHQLLDHASSSRTDPRLVLACARSLLNNGANVMQLDPRTRQTALERASCLMSSGVGPQWKQLWQTRGNWTVPLKDKKSARQIWDEASPQPKKSSSSCP